MSTKTTKGSWSRVSDWEAYRSNPFWNKTKYCETHGRKIRNGRCWECDWEAAKAQIDGGENEDTTDRH